MTPTPKPSQPPTLRFEPTASGDVKVGDDDRVYVTAGDVIADKYIVERLLGVGGIGFVVAARHVQLGGYFALKFLKRRYLRQPNVVERFTREARAACRLQSEYIARVYDVGTSDGVPFLVMEYLTGRDLAVVLAEGGRLGADDAVEYVIHACVALASAHAHGIIHRDIKPENLFRVEHDGLSSIKLLDFGISKVGISDGVATTSASARLTGSHVLGTPFYMSPEQIRATAQADVRSDIWSLGVVLYELLTGNVAFPGDGVTEICAAILEREPAPLLEVRPELEPGLADVLSRCLQKDPAARFRNMAELAIALLPFAPLRALAVAEGSSSIRRAAIHAIGGGSDPNARASGSMRISGSLAPVDPVVNSTRPAQSVITGPILETAAAPRRRGMGLMGGALAVVAAVAVTAALVRRPVPIGSATAAAAPRTGVPTPSAPFAGPVTAAVRPASSPELEPSAPVPSDAPRASVHPVVYRPQTFHGAPPVPKPLAAASHSAAAVKSAAPTIESVAPPPPPPAPTRSRPDVGY
ncbi:MAG TPA: protein kinase [Polyangiaceae bacterium]